MLLESKPVVVRRKQLAVLSVAVVSVFVALPIWWKTTEVYRAALPYEAIEVLSHQKDTFVVRRNIVLSILWKDEAVKKEVLSAVRQYLAEKQQRLTGHVNVLYSVNESGVPITTALEQALLTCSSRHKAIDVLSTILPNAPGDYSVTAFPNTLNDRIQLNSRQSYVGNSRTALVQFNTPPDAADVGLLVTAVLDQVLVDGSIESVDLVNSTAGVDKRMTRLRPFADVQLSFTLANADPSSLQTDWNIAQAVNDQLMPFLELPAVSALGTYHIESQLLYYADLKMAAVRRDGIFKVSADNLPQSLTVVETRLGFQVSQRPSLNFVIVVPPRATVPLLLYHPPDWEHGFTSFLSPQWGGLVIHNYPNTTTSDHLMVDMTTVMPTFIEQLKRLLGVPEVMPISNDIKLEQLEPHQLYDWQADAMMVSKMIEYQTLSSSTLWSLVKLLGEVKNMVISDNIQQEVVKSLDALEKSKLQSSEGDLESAYRLAKCSMHSAETAFFDPSILALLYFPDDQKFAIYIPLFLPVSIPILLSAIQVGRQLLLRTADHEKKE